MDLSNDAFPEIAQLPAGLRLVVKAELAAGNEVSEVLCGHPVPPMGVGIRLVRPLSVVMASTAKGVQPCRFPAWDGSCGYSDESKQNFVLGPPGVSVADPPSMEEIRDAANRPAQAAAPTNQPAELPSRSVNAPDSPLGRFEKSLKIDHDKWRDGIGYDLDAIHEASPEERVLIEAVLLRRGASDWRDIQALAVLDSPRAREALQLALTSRKHEIALAVVRYAPQLVDEETRTTLVVCGLKTATAFDGLTQTLAAVEDFHPAPVVEALFQGTLRREGEVAVHFAAMLMFLHGQAETDFDMDQRPFFLTFHTQDPTARKAAFRELCRRIGVEAGQYLDPE